jgi:hypothetical protein
MVWNLVSDNVGRTDIEGIWGGDEENNWTKKEWNDIRLEKIT